MQLEISEPLEVFFKHLKKSTKDDIRKIKKYGFTYEFTSDPKKFELFYQNIYLPFILDRHGKQVLPEAIDYLEIKTMFEKGRLLLVKENREIISGFVIYSQSKTAVFMYAGVKLEPDYLTKSAGSALYYFFINWAKKQGFKVLKFGGARPFLEDGLFRYKRKWGMTAKISSTIYGVLGFKSSEGNVEKAMKFIENNPLMYIEQDELKAMIFMPKITSVETIQKIWKKYYTPGLSELTIISGEDFPHNVKSFVESNYQKKIKLKKQI